jgi:hypothetical protein
MKYGTNWISLGLGLSSAEVEAIQAVAPLTP